MRDGDIELKALCVEPNNVAMIEGLRVEFALWNLAEMLSYQGFRVFPGQAETDCGHAEILGTGVFHLYFCTQNVSGQQFLGDGTQTGWQVQKIMLSALPDEKIGQYSPLGAIYATG